MSDYSQLPADLPVPVDDGAAEGLVGREVPDLELPATMAVDPEGGGGLRLTDLANGLLEIGRAHV